MLLLGKLENLPMPPSVNACYATAGRRRVSSQALRKFKSEMQLWGLIHRPELIEARNEVQAHLGAKICLKFMFRFPGKKLWLKKGKDPKKLDVSNRIKPAEDAVCEFLGIDDRVVFRVEAEKQEGDKEEFSVHLFKMS